MYILYDGEIFLVQTFGGINTYFYNLWSRLPDNMNARILQSDHGLASVHKYPRTEIENIVSAKFGLKSLSSLVEKFFHQRRLHGAGANLLHPTYYSLLTGLSINKIRLPIVLTVWDMIHELFPSQYDPTGVKAAVKKKAIMAADAIICISENTKQDLMAIYNVPETRISVILLASGMTAPAVSSDRSSYHLPFFLYVGGRKYHKNFFGLLTAFAHVAMSNKEISLFVVGRSFQEYELKQISDLRLTDRVYHKGEVSDDELAILYSRSIALIYPSLYEGFGIPPLEAMACGTMAIVSNRSSIPEVVGPAALQFDPDLNGDLEDKLFEVIKNPALRDYFIRKGGEWVRRYDWKKTAEQTFKIYNIFGD